LCLQCDNTMPIPKDITIEKYNISLLEVTPYPKTTNKNATQIAKMVVK
jgi:hypothetical protein